MAGMTTITHRRKSGPRPYPHHLSVELYLHKMLLRKYRRCNRCTAPGPRLRQGHMEDEKIPESLTAPCKCQGVPELGSEDLAVSVYCELCCWLLLREWLNVRQLW